MKRNKGNKCLIMIASMTTIFSPLESEMTPSDYFRVKSD